MKRNLLLVSAVVIAALTSCTTDSELDQSIVSATSSDASTQTPIEFTTYASSAATTKGAAVTSNTDFKSVGSFDVAALVSDGTFTYTYNNDNEIETATATPIKNTEAVKYFNLSGVTYSDSDKKWENNSKMYWPNYSKIMHFAAYSPAGLITDEDDYTFTCRVGSGGNENYIYSFKYTVTDVIGDQDDLMYAMTSVDYLAPSDKYKRTSNTDNTPVADSYVTTGVDNTNAEGAVNLHFKHALTQIAFTAIKDSDIEVYVKSLTICNVYNSGKFTAIDLTDDSDDSSSGDDTVGNSDDASDKVNANNFGTWETIFDTSGWGTLTGKPKSYGTGYYTSNTSGHSSMSNYEAALVDYTNCSPDANNSKNNSIKIGDSLTTLTSSSEVLMLMPQKLTAWVPTTSTEPNFVGWDSTTISSDITSNTTTFNTKLSDDSYASSTADNSLSYLAIDCEIYHQGIDDSEAMIHSGYIFVPFETKDIDYASANVDNPDKSTTDEWLAGYRITYCLEFGGGYIVDEDNHDFIPDPGCIPDTETYTLRTITYTTTCDTWVEVSGGSMDLGEFDTSDSSASN